MALLHRATLSPSKLELLTAHVRSQTGFTDADPDQISLVGAYRFDDPAGQVGIETHIVADGTERFIHVPLTYRAEAVPGAEAALIGTMEHSVLGTRWIYDACSDPVYARELLRTILTGGSQVAQYFEGAEGREFRNPTATVAGSGAPGTAVPESEHLPCTKAGTDSIIPAGDQEIVVRHLPTPGLDADRQTLTGSWEGVDTPRILAFLR